MLIQSEHNWQYVFNMQVSSMLYLTVGLQKRRKISGCILLMVGNEINDESLFKYTAFFQLVSKKSRSPNSAILSSLQGPKYWTNINRNETPYRSHKCLVWVPITKYVTLSLCFDTHAKAKHATLIIKRTR